MQMKFYNKDKLLQVARDRGYVSIKAIGDALMRDFGTSSKTVQNRISNGKLSKEECEVIGSYFNMTMKEYYDIFMHGLFQEDNEGHYVCQVDNHYLHLHPGTQQKSGKKTKQDKIDEIIFELSNIE